MKKRLILIGGPMGVGKTVICQELVRLLPKNVFLDGDWCWNMQPFVVNDETKAMVMGNICDMLNRFIACSAYENILFCWVMHRQEIIDEILSRLNLEGVKVCKFSIVAAEPVLTGRIRTDMVLKGLRSEETLQRSLEYLPGYDQLDTVKIENNIIDIRDVAKQIAKLIKK